MRTDRKPLGRVTRKPYKWPVVQKSVCRKLLPRNAAHVPTPVARYAGRVEAALLRIWWPFATVPLRKRKGRFLTRFSDSAALGGFNLGRFPLNLLFRG